MKLFSKIFKPKQPKDIWKDSPYVIKYAFTSGGVDYYCFDDLVNTPYDRSLCAIDYFTELSMNCDREFLILHTKAIKELLHGKKTIDVFAINKLNDQLSERVNFIKSPDLIYKLASIVYFDKSENPIKYDFKYNVNKIVKWKKDFPDGSFFLSMPIKALVPSLTESHLNLETYQKVWKEIDSLHLESLLSELSEMDKPAAMSKIAAL